MRRMPRFISLKLYETDTFYILDIGSSVLDKDTAEGKEAEAENQRYAYLTQGKGRNRKTTSQSIQTLSNIVITRDAQKDHRQLIENHAYASTWDMYDTYNGISNDYLNKILVGEIENYTLKTKHKKSRSEEEDDEEELSNLIHKTKFLDAVEIIERLLANNNFNVQQKRFRGLADPDPLRDNIKFNYRLNFLWTFSNEKTNGRSVSCFKWNPINKDLLAVGYGKFYFEDDTDGAVMIWNIKNPVQPERFFQFEVPVTSLNFSNQNCHLLGVGFYNGRIKILDISSRYLNVITETTWQSFQSFEPIWQVHFETNEHTKSEDIISVGRDGKICRTGPVGPNPLITTQILRICKTEGKLKGLKSAKRFADPGIRVSRYQTTLVSCQHPVEEKIYFVGTGEGSIHKCSKYRYYQELDVFSAHEGPIYTMKFSPFCNKLLLTCGDDWNIRIWCEGTNEPLLELRDAFASVQGADWSPTHSTIIASISGQDIVIWDIQRKIFSPQSVTKSPTNSWNTLVEFTEDGRCIIVGDVHGNVHFFALEDMPFAPFFQADYLTRSLQRALISKENYFQEILRKGLCFKSNILN